MAEPKEPLTERELEVVRLVATGASNKEIGAQLFVSPNTVRVHLRNIFTKLEAQSRTEVTMIAVRNGWVDVGRATPAEENARSASSNQAGDALPPSPMPVPDARSRPSVNGQTQVPEIAALRESDHSPLDKTAEPDIAASPAAISETQATTQAAETTTTVETAQQHTPVSAPPPSGTLMPQPFAPVKPLEPLAQTTSAIVPVPVVSAQVIPARITPVPVAPNPQLNAPLALWRRAVLVAAALLLVVGTILVLPRAPVETNAAGDSLTQESPGNASVALSPENTTRWYARTSVRTARARSAVTTAAGQIYVIGGDVEHQPSSDVLVYDPRYDTWLETSRKTTPVMNTGAAVVGNMIFVPGGTTPTERASSVFEAYDVQSKTWTSLAPMPSKLAGHAVATFDDKIYVIGGQTASRVSGEVFMFDTRANRWSSLANLPTPRSQLAAVVANGRIYAVGGFDGQRELATCEYFQITEGQWHSCAPMTIPRGGLGLAIVGATLYAVGGSGFIGFNERYDVATDKWVPFEIPPSRVDGWRNVGVASLPSDFYVVGGSTRGTLMADTYVYEVMNNHTFLPAFNTGQTGQTGQPGPAGQTK